MVHDKREAILEAAEVLFAADGFEGTSTRALAARAGVNLAMLSYYFGSKEGVFETLIQRRTGKTYEDIQRIDNQSITQWEKLDAVVDLYVDKVLGNGCLHKIIAREMASSQRAEIKEAMTAAFLRNSQAIIKIIHDGQAQGLFRVVDAPLTCASLIGTIFQIINSSAFAEGLTGHPVVIDGVFTDYTKTRLKRYLKDLLRAQLTAH